MSSAPGDEAVRAATLRWLDRAVVGLNLCPFARGVRARGQVRCVVSAARTDAEVLHDLELEVAHLVATDPLQLDTTLLVLPHAAADFLYFAQLALRADRLLRRLGQDGVLQLATFHPQYQFADAGVDDIGNCTNRAPYPVLHLLREASVAQAVNAMPDTAAIYRNNILTLEQIGHAGWAALDVGPALLHSAKDHGA